VLADETPVASSDDSGLTRAITPHAIPDLASLEPFDEDLTATGEREDLERWLPLVPGIPSLKPYTAQFEQLDEYFLTQDLSGEDLQLWRAIREVIMQRLTGVYDDILPLTDIILQDLFHFLVRHERLRGLRQGRLRKAVPLTFLGRSEDYYYTYAGDHDLPVAIVSIPQSRLHSVWNWLAIPHEVGHHAINHFPGYEDEIKAALIEALREAPARFEERRDAFEFDDAKLLAHIWFFWLDEVIADLFGILYTGPAQVMARQDDFGWWQRGTSLPINGAILGSHLEGAGRHPAAYVRSLFQCDTLRSLGLHPWADRLEQRWHERWGVYKEISFYDDLISADEVPLARISVASLRDIYAALLPRLIEQPFVALGNNRLLDLITYDADDHERVERIARCLLGGVCAFGRKDRARHILAASRLAYEIAPSQSKQIHVAATLAIQACREWLR